MAKKLLIDEYLTNQAAVSIDATLPIIQTLNTHLDKKETAGELNINYTVLIDMLAGVLASVRSENKQSVHELCLFLNRVCSYFHHIHILKLNDIYVLILKFQDCVESTFSYLSKENAILLQVVGQIERDLFLTQSAQVHLEESISILYKLKIPADLEISTGLSRMGNVYRDLGDNGATYTVMTLALEKELLHFGHRHQRVALTRNDFGKLLRDMNQLTAAIAEFKQAISIYEETLSSPFHPDYARCLGNLGTCYLKINQFYKASSCFEKAFYIQDKLTDSPCYHKVITQSNWGESLYGLKQLKAAEIKFKQTLDWLAILKKKRESKIEKRFRKTDPILNKLNKRCVRIKERLAKISGFDDIERAELQYINRFVLGALKLKLERLMHQSTVDALGVDFVYYDCELSLNKLSDLLSDLLEDSDFKDITPSIEIRPYELSEFINHIYGKNFSCYINDYRTQQAKRFLIEKPQLNILRIGSLVGFASESAFSNAFKRRFGLTPGKFRRQNR